MMDIEVILSLVKTNVGIITSTARDSFITTIINSIITELTDEKGLTLDADNMNHLMFVVDYATWRYDSRHSQSGMPRHLQFRLHNLMIHNKEVVE